MTETSHMSAAGRLIESWTDLHRRNRALSAEIARRTGLAVSTMWLMAQLANLGEARVADIAAELHVDPSVASRQIGCLEQDGYVTRRPDPADGRASLVRLTDDGARVLDEVRSVRRSTISRALAEWPAAELDRLGEDLRHMGRRITEVLDEGGPR